MRIDPKDTPLSLDSSRCLPEVREWIAAEEVWGMRIARLTVVLLAAELAFSVGVEASQPNVMILFDNSGEHG